MKEALRVSVQMNDIRNSEWIQGPVALSHGEKDKPEYPDNPYFDVANTVWQTALKLFQ